jgi:predicted MFS family arabinose efflux permease
MALFAVMGVGYHMMHNCFQAQVTELSPRARASAVALHAFSFFMGQAVGVPVVGFAISALGQTGGLALLGTVAMGVGLVAFAVLRRPAT